MMYNSLHKNVLVLNWKKADLTMKLMASQMFYFTIWL